MLLNRSQIHLIRTKLIQTRRK